MKTAWSVRLSIILGESYPNNILEASCTKTPKQHYKFKRKLEEGCSRLDPRLISPIQD